MDGKIAILTATYNHSNNISTLYKSLVNQTQKNFRWIIVNDGSKDNTENVIEGFLAEQLINIEYITKNNSGKSSTLNLTFDRISDDEMVVIVDDDEELDSDAIEKLDVYYEKYYGKGIGVIHFHRRNRLDMKIIANYRVGSDLALDYISFKNSGKNADGYLAYFGYSLKDIRFPIYPKEKYVGPSVLVMRCCETYRMIWAKEVIGTTEYLNDGITKQGRRLRIRNPLGMMKYCECFQNSKSSIKIRLKYSVMGYAYKSLSKKSKKELIDVGIDTNKYIWYTKPFGMLLGIYWRKKYS